MTSPPQVDGEPTALADLLARVEAATGPDRELDARLWCFDKGYRFIRLSTDDDYQPPYTDCEPGPQWRERGMPKVGAGLLLFFDPAPGMQPGGKRQWPHHNRMSGWTRYTASLDAALALVERVLPGMEFSISTARSRKGWSAKTWVSDDKYSGRLFDAPTPALALLAALLKSLIAKESGQ